jgi:hypothetical protein
LHSGGDRLGVGVLPEGLIDLPRPEVANIGFLLSFISVRINHIFPPLPSKISGLSRYVACGMGGRVVTSKNPRLVLGDGFRDFGRGRFHAGMDPVGDVALR